VGSGEPESRPTPRNLLRNGSFENGADPWFDFRSPKKPYWGTFSISRKLAFEGEHSLLTALDSDDFAASRSPTGIAGTAQHVLLSDFQFPRRLTGRYRVEAWQRGTANQYVQLVIAMGWARNFAEMGRVPVQLSFVLAGVEKPPIPITNRFFVFVGPAEPELGRWIPFDIDLHEAFRTHWGRVPEARAMRFFVEARFDGYDYDRDQRASAEVYFDALHMGD
jgi:hypothetical protein